MRVDDTSIGLQGRVQTTKIFINKNRILMQKLERRSD